MKRILLTLFSFSVIIVYSSCKKDAQCTTVKVKLTDTPAAYDEVNVDIREVNVKMDNDSSAWITLPTAAGIYNLLEYQDGVDTLIAEAVLSGSKIKEIRLVLGSANYIRTGGDSIPIVVPSGSESGLKIKLNHTLSGNIDYLTLDFDAGLSVKQENGEYKLRPVVKVLP
jgi:hypothetical protein